MYNYISQNIQHYTNIGCLSFAWAIGAENWSRGSSERSSIGQKSHHRHHRESGNIKQSSDGNINQTLPTNQEPVDWSPQ